MGLRDIRRAMQRKVAKQGTAVVLQEVRATSKKTEQQMLKEQKEHARKISALMMAVPTLVLVRDMKWKPLEGIPEDNNRKIREFAEKLMLEIERTNDDPNFDIGEYCEKVYEKTGVRYNYSKNGTA